MRRVDQVSWFPVGPKALVATFLCILLSSSCGAQEEQIDSVVLLGGWSGSSQEFLTDSELIFDDLSTCVAQIPHLDPGLARFGSVASFLDPQLILCGLLDGTYCLSVDLRNMAESWQSMAGLNEAREYATSCQYEGKMYVMGGYSPTFGTALSSVEIYDLDSLRWKVDRSMALPSPRERHCSVVIDGVLYVIGGVGYDSMISYDLTQENAEWHTLASLPEVRYDHACASYPVDWDQESTGIVVAGGSSIEEEFILETWFYDPTINAWQSMGKMWNPRKGHGMASLGGIATVFGGFDFVRLIQGNATKLYLETDMIEIFENGQWLGVSSHLSTPRMDFAHSVVPQNIVQCSLN
ncbi:hypothetical protein TCAL_12134 [Tigriopus californicus]|uniref:Uncharacterized protein n=1 Tax=Tigriopus californicus TaxID=6832 RepID=A0A553PBD1_TIGCA|nr:kelch-like protein 33 [Tigriopus californicus]TRY74983.1 hypothetical protein TCAL_12134 [Tigriopus californicus]|eukprot:TCALIF_12134-PA protein Name:"Similar to KLHL33 Kelch-like protein 33 (Homo sapiens)" AED:0.02 eAED:0.02 QI:49/1/0.5/1/1/1/2/0/351